MASTTTTPSFADEAARLRHEAERCVRQVKDLGYDDAVVLMVATMLEVRRATQAALMDEVEARLKELGPARVLYLVSPAE